MISNILDRFEEDFDGVAGAGDVDVLARLVLPLVELDDAFGLVADVDDDVVAADFENAAGDDLVGFEFLRFGGKPGWEPVVAEWEQSGEFGFVFVVVELAEEVAIDHSLDGEARPGGSGGQTGWRFRSSARRAASLIEG